MTRDAGFKRRVRARAAKTGAAYSTARHRLDRAGAGGDGRRPLHVTNGDSVTGTLRRAGVAGRILTWADVLHDGPVPAAGAAEQLGSLIVAVVPIWRPRPYSFSISLSSAPRPNWCIR